MRGLKLGVGERFGVPGLGTIALVELEKSQARPKATERLFSEKRILELEENDLELSVSG